MAAATKSPSPSAHIQANSPWDRHKSRRSAASRSSPSPPLSLSRTVVDHEQFVTSSSTTFPSRENDITVAASSSLGEDGPAAGADTQLDNTENDDAAKKPAWNMPSDGVSTEAGAVMGAESWPALSVSACASPKSLSVSSLKSPSYGSITVSEGMVGFLSSPKESDTSISTPSSTSNPVKPAKRGGDSSSHNSMPANDSLSLASPVLGAFAATLPQNARNSGGSIGESTRDKAHRDAGQRGRSFGGNEQQQQQQQHSPFRNNNGPHAQWNGYHRHGVKYYPQRSFGSREILPSKKRDGSRPFVRGPAPNAPFLPPPPRPVAMRPFVTPMVYQEIMPHVFYVPGAHPDPFRSMPMVPYSPMLFPMPDLHLPSKILSQIDYYFSNENLVKDTYLRKNMDGEGWVSIKLIAGFKKVMQLTDNIHLILDALQASNVVEVQVDKVRRKNDWIKWIMPPTQYSTVTSGSIHDSNKDILAAHLDSVTLGEKAAT